MQGDTFLGWAEKSIETAPLAENSVQELSLAQGAAELCRQSAEAYEQVRHMHTGNTPSLTQYNSYRSRTSVPTSRLVTPKVTGGGNMAT
eukprot:2519828-Pyramimonas_sp.AAC.1